MEIIRMININVISGLSNILAGLLIIAVCVPLLKGKIQMNRWYGIRMKKSFESEENWYKINRYGAQRMILWSLVIVTIGIAELVIRPSGKGYLWYAISSTPILLIIIPAIESWLYAKKL
jgi:uncharacterized membrane protein